MIVSVRNRVSDFKTYRAERVKSLFNAENGCNFDLDANIDIDGKDWSIGVIVGPSGSGKTSIGRQIFGGGKIVDMDAGWSTEKPIVEDISPDAPFDDVTGALASVGLGSVPSWLRPYAVLSNGEKFRAGLARIMCEMPDEAVVDEFTSVIDRQIAKIGSMAFQKSWRRAGGEKKKIVLLTPHYDILDWIEPDWVFDTKDGRFEMGRLRRRPKIQLEVRKVNGSFWRYYKPHYYLNLPMPIAAEYFIGTVEGELACHLAVCPHFHMKGYRATRMVTMPEWQGAGLGTKFLDFICQYHLEGKGRRQKKFPTYFHTSHPQLCAYLRRSKRWRQVSAILYGGNKNKSNESITKAQKKTGTLTGTGFGGHLRAVQGFKYIGEELGK
jgi:ABC-type lipoprotein export system ATPase subunit